MGDVMLAGIGVGLLTYEDVKKWQVLDEKIMPNRNTTQSMISTTVYIVLPMSS